MIPVKRLEIVIDAPHAERVTRILAARGFDGWTVLRNASGFGDRGQRQDDGISSVSSNQVIVTTCPPERLDEVIEELRSLLARVGGVCLVSDAHWLLH